MLDLESAIKHCEEEAEKNEITAKSNLIEVDKIKADGILRVYDANEYESCLECAKEHRQLAEWLKALKEIWDSGDCNDCRNGQCEWKPELGQLVRYNCPHYVGIANEEVKAEGGAAKWADIRI